MSKNAPGELPGPSNIMSLFELKAEQALMELAADDDDSTSSEEESSASDDNKDVNIESGINLNPVVNSSNKNSQNTMLKQESSMTDAIRRKTTVMI